MGRPEKCWIILRALDCVVNLILTLLISFVSTRALITRSPPNSRFERSRLAIVKLLSFHVLNDSFFFYFLSVEKVSEGEKVQDTIVSSWADR